MVMRLAVVRKLGLTNAADHEQHSERGQQRQIAQAREFGACASPATARHGTAAPAPTATVAGHTILHRS